MKTRKLNACETDALNDLAGSMRPHMHTLRPPSFRIRLLAMLYTCGYSCRQLQAAVAGPVHLLHQCS